MSRHARKFAPAILVTLFATSLAVAAPAPQPTDLTPQLRRAGLAIDHLMAFEIGGIVVIRGAAADLATAEQAGRLAQSLGYSRVANLVQVVTPPDDMDLQRRTERELWSRGSLDGCTFRVDSQKGVVHLAGSVDHELQKDYAIEVVRAIHGVREVTTDLKRR